MYTGKGVVVKKSGQVAAAPYGSAGILPIPYMYIRMMGRQGLLDSSRVVCFFSNPWCKFSKPNAINVEYDGDE